MLMALDAGVIDGACVPEFVGKYMLAHHDDLRAGMFEFSNTKECYYLGFYNNAQLRDRVNEALSDMKADGTLQTLQAQYTKDVLNDPAPVEFEVFGVADVIFWYLYGENYVITDMENGIQLSNPYYELEDWLYIEKKN